MSLTTHLLGAAGQDNALLVQVDSGQSVERLLFDCGEGCLSGLPFAEIQAIDHLLFSHQHMDHVAGFDTFFRGTFDRDSRPNQIWGPPGTARILQHRFQGFLWNLHEVMSASWRVSDVYTNQVHTFRCELSEAFREAHDEGLRTYAGMVLEGEGYTVEAISLDHKTTTLGYIVREKPRSNINTSRLAKLGLKPGPWLKQLKEAAPGQATLLVNGTEMAVANLRAQLLVETPGDAVAYLTDFLLDDPTLERLVVALQGCPLIYCEGQYRHADLQLARKYHHTTTVQVATLARRAGVQELVLFHLSARYQPSDWLDMLEEARAIFPNTRFTPEWGLETQVS